jgi:hypothetical protein
VSVRKLTVLLAVIAALVWSGTALASGSGLIDQYVEDVPTSGGHHYPGASGGGTGGSSGGGGSVSGGGTSGSVSGGSASSGSVNIVPLSSSAKKSLHKQGGKDTKALATIATSPRYGAPVASSNGQLQPATTPSAFDAAVSAVGDGGSKSVGFVIALLVATAVAVGLAASRRRA